MNDSKKIISINRAKPVTVEYRHRLIETGIYKQPVPGSVFVGVEGLEGDVQVDRANHGGPDKAVYVYSHENYPYWAEVMGHTGYACGHFGENLTVTNMPDESVHIGDIWQIGTVITQVTQPRVPCFKLGMKMEDAGFVERFLHSGRVGFYLRILETGYLEAGQSLRCLETGLFGLSIRAAMLAIVKNPGQSEIIQQALSIPALSEAWRQDLQKRLQALNRPLSSAECESKVLATREQGNQPKKPIT